METFLSQFFSRFLMRMPIFPNILLSQILITTESKISYKISVSLSLCDKYIVTVNFYDNYSVLVCSKIHLYQ
jgi:hypothetical protein